MTRAVGSLLAAGLLALSASASAQEEPESPAVQEARQRFELGTRHAEQGDWALALTEWERVRSILESVRHPRSSYVVYNIARANEELGRTREAIEAYERYLAATANDPEAPSRDDAERHLRELRVRRQLQGAEEGTTAGREQSASAGFSPSPVGLAIGGIGAAAVVAGAIVGGLALSQGDAARADCVGTRCTPEAHAAIGDAQTLANAADALLWGGVAVLAAGVVLTIALGDSGEARASAACTGDGCMAVLEGRF